MNIKTYRAKSMREALEIVRRDLGPDAAVLHTREVQNRRLFGLLQGDREIEVTASVDVNVPSRLPQSHATVASEPGGQGNRSHAEPQNVASQNSGSIPYPVEEPHHLDLTSSGPEQPDHAMPSQASSYHNPAAEQSASHDQVTYNPPNAPRQPPASSAPSSHSAIDWRNHYDTDQSQEDLFPETRQPANADQAFGTESTYKTQPEQSCPTNPTARHASISTHGLDTAGSLRLQRLAEQVSQVNARMNPQNSDQAAPGDPRIQSQITELHSMLEELCRRSLTGSPTTKGELPDTLFRVFTELIDADLSEDVARELVERVREEASDSELVDPVLIKSRISRMIESQIPIGGPIQVTPGERRVVALVGPTGVGKTTTIAKLAAHYRLKQRRKVGFITVDTYRIAAVEQLRTYAEIIDLPMEVVSTPREMRYAVERLGNQDLILIDTAGRSPHDDIRIQELKALLGEAGTDETHLVLSSVVGPRTLLKTAQRFATVGTTGLIMTKLDEATGLGGLFPVIRGSGLALHYMTMGQNVPDDIETAEAGRVARLLMGIDPVTRR